MSDPSMTVGPTAWLIQRLGDDGESMSQSLRFYEEPASDTVVVTALVPASLLTKQADEIERLTRERDAVFEQHVSDLAMCRGEVSAAEARIAVLEAALTNIRELNMSGVDVDGHRWANSDLIEQEIVFTIRARTTP